MHIALCLCSELNPIETKTRVLILMHVSEAQKPTSTGNLAHLMLPNADVRLRGLPHLSTVLDDVVAPVRGVNEEPLVPLVLFPARDAIPLDQALQEDRDLRERRINLIVPEGTWRQARKVITREPKLANVPIVRLPDGIPTSKYGLRRNVRSRGHLCTLEAIAVALEYLGEPAATASLLQALELMVDRVRRSRGLSGADDLA
ncbi:MAG: DTW domain-containing protein [Deltaproteobacteria bacterium]|nr:DTW domain-containing protein [Deltaproteobacteria bacterium]